MIRTTIGLAVIVAALVTACGNPATPSPPASASPVASSTPTPTAASPSASAAAACVSSDIVATGGPWGGAAGSRGSDIVVQNGSTAPCLLPAAPTIAVVDQAGTVLLTSAAPPSGAGPELAAGGSVGFSLLLGNWCDGSVNLPLHFRLALASDGIDIGALTAATVDDLPPCNGPGQPATLSATDWQPG